MLRRLENVRELSASSAAVTPRPPQPRQRLDRAIDRGQLGGREPPSRSASHAVRRRRTERSARTPFGVSASRIAARVLGGARAHDEPGLLHPVEVARHRGGGHALARGELANAQLRVGADLREQRGLAAGDPLARAPRGADTG